MGPEVPRRPAHRVRARLVARGLLPRWERHIPCLDAFSLTRRVWHARRRSQRLHIVRWASETTRLATLCWLASRLTNTACAEASRASCVAHGRLRPGCALLAAWRPERLRHGRGGSSVGIALSVEHPAGRV